jgi:hypothetical protein
MNPRVTSEISAAIRRLIADIAQQTEPSIDKEVVEATGELPVYKGWTGALAVTPAGEVIFYDYETKAGESRDEGWQVLAITKAARRFPELKDLAPPKPSTAVSCPSCGGLGTVFGRFDCGTCWASGWIVLPDKRDGEVPS